jgi:hypothetical protein
MSKQLVVPLAKIGMEPDKPVSEIHMGISVFKYLSSKGDIAPVKDSVGKAQDIRTKIIQMSLFPQIGDHPIKKVIH